MVENENDILQLRFEGNGVKPSTVKPSEISELINEFQNTLLSTIKQDYPEIDTDTILFTLDGVRDESLGIDFKAVRDRLLPQVKNAVVSSFTLVATSVGNKDFANLNNNTIQSLKKISTFTKKHNCNAEFNFNGKNLLVITPLTEIKEIKIPLLKGDLNVYGEIVEVGNNIHLKLNEGYTIYIDADRTVSKSLGSKLWDYVGLRGTAHWNPLTSEIQKFKLIAVLDYTPGNVAKTFAEIREISSGVWDNYNSVDEISKRLLRD